MRSGTATLNRRATGFAAGAFFLLLAATPNSSRHYYRTPTVYHPAPETASKIMQEPDTKPDSKARCAESRAGSLAAKARRPGRKKERDDAGEVVQNPAAERDGRTAGRLCMSTGSRYT
jgi:hypothetical protein